MLLNPQTILFDWDNTLVNTWATIHTSINKTLIHYNHPALELEDFKKQSHHSLRNIFPQIFKEHWHEARNFFYESIKECHLKQLEILPYAQELLDFLKGRRIPLGVISNKHSDILKKEIEHLGWQDYFKIIIGSGDTEHDKPHPEPILLALKKMGNSPSSDHWYVGDTITDWQAAHASGCQPVALWTNPLPPTIATDYPIPYIESCYELYLKVLSFEIAH